MRWLLVLILALAAAGCSLRRRAHTALYRIDADGRGLMPLLSSPDKDFWGPAVSPDGKQIVFTYGNDKNGDELYLAGADGGELRPLTHNGRSNYLPAWSPDGKTISFISQNGSDRNSAEIYTVAVDGGRETRLTQNDAWEYGTSWSPDGRSIVFGSERGGRWQIYTMQPDGSEQLPLGYPAHGNAPVWSPDGTRIAFTSDRDGDDEIWVMNPDGTDQRNLTNNNAWDDNPQWSPDGSRIAFTSDRDGGHNLFVMNADGSQPLNETSGLRLDIGIASWSPSGAFLIFHAARAGG